MADFASLLAQIPPGTVSVILTTPIGTQIIDPLAPPDPATQRALEAMGIHMTVRLGAPTAEELAQPSLAENLKTLGILGAGAAALYFLRPKNPWIWAAGAAGVAGYMFWPQIAAAFQPREVAA